MLIVAGSPVARPRQTQASFALVQQQEDGKMGRFPLEQQCVVAWFMSWLVAVPRRPFSVICSNIYVRTLHYCWLDKLPANRLQHIQHIHSVLVRSDILWPKITKVWVIKEDVCACVCVCVSELMSGTEGRSKGPNGRKCDLLVMELLSWGFAFS